MVRALLDQGSEASFVSESLAQLLQLPRTRVNVPLSGIGASRAGTARALAQLNLRAKHDPSFSVNIEALILPRLTSEMPSRRIHDFDFSALNGLQLADEGLSEPGKIDLILGADVICQILKSGFRRLSPSQLIAQDTIWGWVISGSVITAPSERGEKHPRSPVQALLCNCDDELQNSLEQFWKIEDVGNIKPYSSPSDEACERHFCDTHIREPDGRYRVRLPVKFDIPNSAIEIRRMAIGALNNLHKRFQRDPILATEYRSFMKAYEDLGHMVKLSEAEVATPRAWYMAHHGVVQENQLKRKLRVVFDGSRRTRDQLCLNDIFHTGPALQSDLFLILLNWRKYRFVFTANMVKMYRQILVHYEDQDLQRIVWSPDPKVPPCDYRLRTVTYGTSCAPFLAIRTLLQIAEDEGNRYPLGARCLRENTYVDDTYAGADDLPGAIKKRVELCDILATAGIELGKWAANSVDILPPQDAQDANDEPKQIDPDRSVKTLGVCWSPGQDSFRFECIDSTARQGTATKRSILSSVTRLYDPLGWLTPVTVTAKILIQDLWIAKCEWDSRLDDEFQKRWSEYRDSLVDLSEVTIPRWLGTTQDTQGCHSQLHGFSDASTRSYAAAVYLRVERYDGEVHVSLLIAKSKVSPVKTTSVPNLELCGAVLLTNLLCYVRKLLVFQNLPVYAWSDSQVVLSWLKKHPCNWKTFVANRVSQIQTFLPSAVWGYVRSKENPSDFATRGIRPADLVNLTLWWNGPKWLAATREYWPQAFDERRALHIRQTQDIPWIIARFSTLKRVVRVVAYCRRFFQNLVKRRRNLEFTRGFLRAQELVEAQYNLIRLEQASHYKDEIHLLHSGCELTKRNPLRKLNPFFDSEQALLRVGGRLTHSSLPNEAKHPPILPKISPLSRLFAANAHVNSKHGGVTLTCSFLYLSVWITGSVSLVKDIIRRCITCQRVKPRQAHQLMGNLPADRVRPSRPFSVSGLDYAGPFSFRTTKGRGHRSYKGYIALFVCFSTRAIHLEAVSDLTTASFLAAYRRFAGRRGASIKLYSDNGTTFHGAARELREMFDEASRFYSEVATALATQGTDWVFIPPNAPHCGGLWEAGVRSVKHHLRRILGESTLTYEEFSTLLIEIEACLNSRPLCPLSADPEDLTALTPAHFLIGESLSLVPEGDLPEVAVNRLDRFQLLQRYRNHFWKRWSVEYLHHLQERYPPAKCPLARITEVHPGPDGLVRVVTLKTATSTLRRHIARLSPLLLPDENGCTNATAGGSADRSTPRQ